MNKITKYISTSLFIFSTIFFIYVFIMLRISDSYNAVTDTDFKVVTYYPYWVGEQFNKLQFDIITHIMYAFAIPSEDGTLLPLANESLANKLIKLTHENNALILLSVGGWSYNNVPLEETFMKATDSPKKINRLTDEIVNMCLRYGFDGVDLDWEYPKSSGQSMERYESLVISLSKRLTEENKLFTGAVMCGVSSSGSVYPGAEAYTDNALSCFDFINVMAYDGGEGDQHSPYSLAVYSTRYWNITRGIPKDKVILGVPFYSDTRISYEHIIESDIDLCYMDFAYINNAAAYYNGINTISDKTKYAVNNLGGIMIWEITQDTNKKDKSLLSTIGSIIKSFKNTKTY